MIFSWKRSCPRKLTKDKKTRQNFDKKEEEKNTEFHFNEKMTLASTTKKSALTGQALEILVVKKTHPLRQRPKLVLHSNHDGSFGYTQPAGYREPLKKMSVVNDC